MFKGFAKASQVCLINIKVIYAFKIALNVTQKSIVNQFNDFVISEFLRRSAMWGKHSKIIIDLVPMCEVGANGSQCVKMDLVHIAFLCLKPVLREDVLGDRI